MNASTEHGHWYESVVRKDGIIAHADGVPFLAAKELRADEVATIDEQYHDAEADTYDSYSEIPRIREAENWIVPWIRRTAQPGVIVDLGTGTGRVAAEIQSPTRHVIAVDRSQNMLAVARRRLNAHHAVVMRADAHDLPLHDGSVDTVICSGVLHHIPSWPDVINEIGRILKPGGLLIVREPNADYPARLFEPLESVLGWVAKQAKTRQAESAPRDEERTETLSPVESPIGLGDLVAAAAPAGLRQHTLGSVKFLASLGIPDAVPGQRMYFVPANLLDRAAYRLTGHRFGSLILATFLKEGQA